LPLEALELLELLLLLLELEPHPAAKTAPDASSSPRTARPVVGLMALPLLVVSLMWR
jgi:hypothetical protein